MFKSVLFFTTWISILLIGLLNISFASSVTDQRGRTIEVTRPFTRIISLYSAHTENLFALGAQSQLIGVSVNDDFPPEIQTKDKFSYHDGPEKYLAAKPDLVLIRPMIDNGYPEFVRQLQSRGIIVISFQPATLTDMYLYWKNLGILTGKAAQADSLISQFKTNVQAFIEATQKIPVKKKVYFQAIHKSMRTFTPGTIPMFVLETAGGINIAEDASASRNTNVAVYSREKILAKSGQIDVILAQKGIMNPVQVSDITNEPGFHVIKAVREGQVYLVDESIVSRPVPRLVEGILTIGNLLYPDIFSNFNTKKDEL